jgi:SAM-dependent methyltransferase
MNESTAQDSLSAAIAVELPADLDDRRVLEVTEAGLPKGVEPEAGRFDFVLCHNALRASPYPMALLTDLWRLTSPGGVLLLEADTLAEPERSQCASFVSEGSGRGWVPGRLALRWMVESCGFDVERWLDQPLDSAAERTCLRAVRAEREPASSTPA